MPLRDYVVHWLETKNKKPIGRHGNYLYCLLRKNDIDFSWNQ